ncbi:ribonuclease III [bacterium]|nr:ribonuclease III [bacterium]
MEWFISLFSGKKKRISKTDIKKLKTLESKLGYSFTDKSLLKRALTHKSFANEHRLSPLEQNERYEFLGDAVLELAVSHELVKLFTEESEGDLSKLRAAVVNETSLAELARKIDLGHYLFLGRGEDQCQGRNKDSLLSDAYEAVLGAIYLDSNFTKAHKVIKGQFLEILKTAKKKDITRDYKTKLQEESQNRFKAIPRYHLVGESGPDHDKTFEVNLYIKNEIYGRGQGKSKKQAEQQAALEALAALEKMNGKE